MWMLLIITYAVCVCAAFKICSEMMVRAAQIYNENCDYEALAKALNEILKKKEEILHTI